MSRNWERSLGVNPWANRDARLMVSIEKTTFDGGASAGDRPDEKVVLTRYYQVGF